MFLLLGFGFDLWIVARLEVCLLFSGRLLWLLLYLYSVLFLHRTSQITPKQAKK